MPFEYIDFERARSAEGLRMVVVSGVPSPWGEAAKGILHLKNLPFQAVRLDPSNDAMAAWTGERSGPVLFFEQEAPRSGWVEILLLAERLAPEPSLLPEDAHDRAYLLGVCHEICGENGLGWMRRLAGITAGLAGEPGFPEPVAHYLAGKYGYRENEAAGIPRRIAALLEMLGEILIKQKSQGRPYYFGDSITALDVYSATFMALFAPLPPELCPMAEALRPGFSNLDEITRKALNPVLTEHRDLIYERHLELPLSL